MNRWKIAIMSVLPMPVVLLVVLLAGGWVSFSPLLCSQSVQFVRSIQLDSGSHKKTIGSFLLGRKKQVAFKPGSLCLLPDHTLCVTDAVNGAVVLLDSRGKIKKHITDFKGGRLVSPVDCCTDDKGNLYIVDSYLRVVLEFDRNGKFKRVFIQQPDTRITGMLFFRNVFYCVDTLNHRILIFNRGGKPEFSFGKRGGGDGEFNFPTHITAGGDYIYITDAMNFRVQVFDQTGKFIRCFGSNGRGGGNFSKPKGLAVDYEQRIFVADAMFDNVQLFNHQGEFLYYFGSPGHGEGEFWMPSDVLVGVDNTIWVADTYNSRIQVFQLLQEAP